MKLNESKFLVISYSLIGSVPITHFRFLLGNSRGSKGMKPNLCLFWSDHF